MKFIPLWFVFSLLFLEFGTDQLSEGNDFTGWLFIALVWFCAFEIAFISAAEIYRADVGKLPEGEGEDTE